MLTRFFENQGNSNIFSPEGPNKAIIGLSAAAVQAEFLLGEGTTTLIKFAAGNKPPVRGILDKPMVLKDLVQEMRVQGVDIFPDYDSHCYIEGMNFIVNKNFDKFDWFKS